MEESVDYAENMLDFVENFCSVRLPKITSFHAAKIALPPKPRVYLQANFEQKKYIIWYLGLLSYFHLFGTYVM